MVCLIDGGERKSGAESRGEILAQAPTGKSSGESKGNPNPGLYYEARGNAFTSERHAPQGQHVRGGCTRSTASAVAACHVVVSESWPAPAPPVDALGAPESMSRRRARALAQSGLISTHIARHRWSHVAVVEWSWRHTPAVLGIRVVGCCIHAWVALAFRASWRVPSVVVECGFNAVVMPLRSL